jgi:hypothetical protein
MDKEDRNKVIDAVAYAFDNGINYFDTAAGYGNGESEKIIGEGLGAVPSSDLYIATKVGIDSSDKVKISIENSMKYLKRDSLDLVQIHGSHYGEREKNMIDSLGVLETLKEFKRQGVIKSIGFTSEDNNDIMYQFMNSGDYDMMQIAYNLILQHPYDPGRPFGSILEAKQKGMGVVTMRATTSTVFQKWIKMVNPESDFNYTPALIQFVLSNPHIDVVLIGMRSKSTVDKNLKIMNDTEGRIDIKELYNWYI